MTDDPQLLGDEYPEFLIEVPSGLELSDAEPLSFSAELRGRLDEFQRVRDRGVADGSSFWVG